MKKPIEPRELVRRYGTDANAFFSLYPGFSMFPSTQGEAGVGYLRTRRAQIGVSEPFAPEKDRLDVLEEFFRYSQERDAIALAMPIGRELARQALERHHEVIPIGTEALFDLDQMRRRGDEWVMIVPAARQLSDKGGGVREIPASERTDELRMVLGEIYQDWNASKRIPPLGFLNRVEPWTLAEDKKLFVIEVAGKVVAFLSAFPIWSRNGWYLVDLIRSPKAPVGATELLLLESMRILHEQGSRWVSLGVAPLSDLKESQFGKRKLLFHILNRVFEYDSDLYASKSLFQFKLKFRPTHLEPFYLVAARGTSIPRILQALGEAYLPQGLIKTVFNSTIRALRHTLGFKIIDKVMDPEIVLRPIPSSIPEFLRRSLISWLLMATWVGIYLQSLRQGASVDADILRDLSFSWQAVHTAHWTWPTFRRIVFSGFFHESLAHLWLNLAMMALIGPTLEMLWGVRVLLNAFFIPMFLSNLMTLSFFHLIAIHVAPLSTHVQEALAMNDVGASLGVFGCFGGLLHSLRRPDLWVVGTILVVVAYTGLSDHWIHLNHLVAMAIGFGVVNLLQWKKRLELRYAY